MTIANLKAQQEDDHFHRSIGWIFVNSRFTSLRRQPNFWQISISVSVLGRRVIWVEESGRLTY